MSFRENMASSVHNMLQLTEIARHPKRDVPYTAEKNGAKFGLWRVGWGYWKYKTGWIERQEKQWAKDWYLDKRKKRNKWKNKEGITGSVREILKSTVIRN